MCGCLCVALVSRPSAQTPATQANTSEDLNFAMDGDLSFGYNDSFGNEVPSTGNLNFGGTANVKGYYYDPKFLSFNASPYYSQSRLNSNYNSVFDSSGITASAQFFSGSHTPGSFSYSRSYNREGQFGLPDAGTYRTRGAGQSFGLGWGFAFPKIPSFDIGYNFGDGSSRILGTDVTGNSNYRTLNLGLGYEIKGFLLSATYLNNHLSQNLPEAVDFSQVINAETTQDTRQVTVSHRLSFNGNVHGGFNRTEYTSEVGSSPVHETFDSVHAGVNLSPIHRLNVGTNVSYTENLAASLLQSILPTSPTGISSTAGLSSNSLDVSEVATYSVTQHLNLQGWLDQRRQEVFGYELTSQLYSGGANYSRDLFGGTLGLYAGISRYNTSAAGATQTGTTDSISYARRLEAWTTSASFHYSRNVESALAAFTQSGYGYSIGVNRVLHGWRWNFSAAGSRNALDAQNTSATFAQNYSSSLAGTKLSFFGSYARSSGNAVQTGAGLVNSPTPVPILPSTLLILYGGDSYSFGTSIHPTERLNISADYLHNDYTTQNDQLSSENRVKQAQIIGDYFYRQMHFVAGYSYLYQAIGTGGRPANFQTVFVGVTRHFDFF
jgi:hypothetical protein